MESHDIVTTKKQKFSNPLSTLPQPTPTLPQPSLNPPSTHPQPPPLNPPMVQVIASLFPALHTASKVS